MELVWSRTNRQLLKPASEFKKMTARHIYVHECMWPHQNSFFFFGSAGQGISGTHGCVNFPMNSRAPDLLSHIKNRNGWSQRTVGVSKKAHSAINIPVTAAASDPDSFTSMYALCITWNYATKIIFYGWRALWWAEIQGFLLYFLLRHDNYLTFIFPQSVDLML